MPFSYPTPEVEGRSNLTSLDIQIKNLRDNTLNAIKDTARRMREEAREPRDTVTDIETWAGKLKVLAEEVRSYCPKMKRVSSYMQVWHLFLMSLPFLCSAPEQHA